MTVFIDDVVEWDIQQFVQVKSLLHVNVHDAMVQWPKMSRGRVIERVGKLIVRLCDIQQHVPKGWNSMTLYELVNKMSLACQPTWNSK